MSRKVCPAAIALIKQAEALRLTSYLCPAGKWTIGWGSTKGVRPGMRITREEAQRRFDEDLAEAARELEAVAPTWLNENQFSALVSWVFNFGIGKLAGSKLLIALRREDLAEVARQYSKWKHSFNKDTGQWEVLEGLVKRRAAEWALFMTPVEGPRVA